MSASRPITRAAPPVELPHALSPPVACHRRLCTTIGPQSPAASAGWELRAGVAGVAGTGVGVAAATATKAAVRRQVIRSSRRVIRQMPVYIDYLCFTSARAFTAGLRTGAPAPAHLSIAQPLHLVSERPKLHICNLGV